MNGFTVITGLLALAFSSLKINEMFNWINIPFSLGDSSVIIMFFAALMIITAICDFVVGTHNLDGFWSGTSFITGILCLLLGAAYIISIFQIFPLPSFIGIVFDYASFPLFLASLLSIFGGFLD